MVRNDAELGRPINFPVKASMVSMLLAGKLFMPIAEPAFSRGRPARNTFTWFPDMPLRDMEDPEPIPPSSRTTTPGLWFRISFTAMFFSFNLVTSMALTL